MDVDLIFRIAAVGILVAVLGQLLSRSGREEQALMKQVSEEVCEAVQMILEKGPDAAMNVYNGRKMEKA